MSNTPRAVRKAGAVPVANPLAADIRPGQSIELLKELHILTREGKLNQDSRRKLKQVYHLFQFIEKLLLELPDGGAHATLADHGAGKSYLGFIIYDLFFHADSGKGRAGEGAPGHIYGIETRTELVDKSRALAAKLGFDHMSFLNLSVAESAHSAELPERIDVVTALHACDTATDDAIQFGLQKKPAVWCWCLAARPKWRGCWASTRRCRWRAPLWPSCGAIRSTPASWAASSPTCCAACTLKPGVTRSR